MGAYNTVEIEFRSKRSKKHETISIQFKYGDTWQYRYHIGDKIKWGGNEIGNKNAKHVVVDGCIENQESSPEYPENFAIHIINGIIEKVIPNSGDYDFLNASDTYIILDDA